MEHLQSKATPKSSPPTVQWKEKIHLFSWQWHSVVMATGACSSLLHSFPYGAGTFGFEVMTLASFLLDLVFFVLLCIWAILRCVMFPEDRASILTDPAKSLFIGFFVNGIASLINAALTVNRDWGTGRLALLYTLWGLWWVDCTLSCIIAFGLVYVMMGQNSRDLSKIGPVWMVPIITLITASSSGGLFTRALIPLAPKCAMISTGVSFTLLAIGLSFTMMLTTAFLLRLYLYGPLESNIVLTTFTTLTPLGQGGFSLLINGQNLESLFPATDAATQLTGRVLFPICICGAYVLWSMGVAWIAVACFSIRRRMANFPRFTITSWCVIVPNAGFALLSLQLAVVLDNEFFRMFGAVWACIVFTLFLGIFGRTIPGIINGSMFRPTSPQKKEPPNVEQTIPTPTSASVPAQVVAGPDIIAQKGGRNLDDGRPSLSRPPSYNALPYAANLQDLEAAVEKLLQEFEEPLPDQSKAQS
ncbi:hypothetical protein BDW22DRAFT_1376036 [Trametopsis cervina]|nr:hypothetical protein BDW22DRAFT_1376036 [Trametopsis cervina]